MCFFSSLLGICDNFCIGKNRKFYPKGVTSPPSNSLGLPLALPSTAVLVWAGSMIQPPWACRPPTSKLRTRGSSHSPVEFFLAPSLGAASVQKFWIMIKNISHAELLIQFAVQTISLRLNLLLAVTGAWCDWKLGAELDKRFAGKKKEGCELDA